MVEKIKSVFYKCIEVIQNMGDKKPILLVEDDQVDAMIVKRAWKDANVSDYLIIRENGEEAMEYLNDDTNEQPAIILLDLNLPKMNGIEF